LLGFILLFAGVWIRSDPNFWEYQDNLPLDNYYAACYLCIYSGALMLVIGFMGCVGTFIDSPCILWTAPIGNCPMTGHILPSLEWRTKHFAQRFCPVEAYRLPLQLKTDDPQKVIRAENSCKKTGGATRKTNSDRIS
ncbi:CD9 antigen-like, partial [Tropilaelaps mercedesae]